MVLVEETQEITHEPWLVAGGGASSTAHGGSVTIKCESGSYSVEVSSRVRVVSACSS